MPRKCRVKRATDRFGEKIDGISAGETEGTAIKVSTKLREPLKGEVGTSYFET